MRTKFRRFKYTYWPYLLWIGVISLVVAMVPDPQAADPPEVVNGWPVIQKQGATSALSTPAFLLASRHQGLIWHPRDSATPLVFTSLAQASTKTGILAYPDVEPSHWVAAPAATNTYHVIWLEKDGALRNALLDSDGQTMRGPITQASGVRRDFVALPHHNERVMLIWIDVSTAQLTAIDLDDVGRPHPIGNLLSEKVDFFAGAVDRADRLHLAWLTSSTPDSWTIKYQISDIQPLALDRANSLLTFTSTPDESITTFAMGLDQTHGYLFWGISATARPDVERVYVLAFPLDRPTKTSLTGLQLPQDFKPSHDAVSVELPLGPIAAVPGSPETTAALRWPRPASGQPMILPLAITLRMPTGWLPAVVYYQGGIALGYQIVAQLPANAGPPCVAVDSSNEFYLAWLGLEGTTPQLYTATTNEQGPVAARPQD